MTRYTDEDERNDNSGRAWGLQGNPFGTGLSEPRIVPTPTGSAPDDGSFAALIPTEQTVKPAGLIERLEAGERNNALDVLIEVATFRPDALTRSCRANNAGTKVIYTGADGKQQTCWARDWSMIPDHAIQRLKSTGEPR